MSEADKAQKSDHNDLKFHSFILLLHDQRVDREMQMVLDLGRV